MSSLHLTDDNVLVIPDLPPERAGALHLPELHAQLAASTGSGRVVGVGPGGEYPMSPELIVGAHVMYSKYAGTDLKVDGVLHLVMREGEIWGVLS